MLLHLKISYAEVVCCRYLLTFWTNVSTEANRVDQDQTGSTLFVEEASKTFHCTPKAGKFVAIDTLRIKTTITTVAADIVHRVWRCRAE